MLTKHSLECFDNFTARFIRSKVNKLIGRAGFTESDRSDLLQDFALDLLQRREKFDPNTATWEAFVVVVCENCYATILEHRQAEMRSPDSEAGSLNRSIKDADGNRTEVGTTISESQQARRTGQDRRSHEEAFDLVHDITHVLDQLPAQVRESFERLMQGTISQVARDMGISRKTVYRRIARMLDQFERAQLRDYI